MLKKMLQVANLKSEKDLLKKYPNEIDFLREHGDKLFEFAEGGEPCYDSKGNIVDCEQQKLQTLGSDAYSRMAPFYNTVFDAANKYANPETGMVSPINSARAQLKGIIKHPEVLFMKRHNLSDVAADPYNLGEYTVDKLGNRTRTWWPTQWSEPKKESESSGKGDERRNRKENRKMDRKIRRGIRNQRGCPFGNCYEGSEMSMGMYGGTFAEGGVPGEEMMMQQGAPMEQQGGGQDQAMQQVVQFIMEALQQKMPQEQIVAKIVEMTGMGQEEAMQILQMVVEKISGGQEAPPQEGGMMPPQGPEEQMMQQGPPPQGMRMGGTPCYKCGGSYSHGGDAPNGRALVNRYAYGGPTHNNSTYSAGVSYKNGGIYMPDYSEYAYGGYYPMYAEGGEPCPGPHMIRNAQDKCVCEEGYEPSQETGICEAIGEDEGEGAPQGTASAPSGQSSGPGISPQAGIPRGGFNAGFGLEGKRYNFDYGFGVGADMKSNVRHNFNLNFPGLFRAGANKGDLGIQGMYAPGKSWSGNLTAGFPISAIKGRKDLLKFTGGLGQTFNDPELDNAMNPNNADYMRINQKKNPVAYNAGLEYSGKMFGEKGPNVKIRASYDKQKYGGTPKYKKGGEYEMTQKEIQDLINKGYKIQYI